MKLVRLIFCGALVAGLVSCADSKPQFDAAAEFSTRCANCHDGSVPKAPHQIKFQLIGQRAIAQAMTTGAMQVHAEGLAAAEVTQLALSLIHI